MSGVEETAPGPPTSHLGVLRRLAQLGKAFFITGNRRETRVLVLAMFALCLAVGVVQVFVSYAGRNFITSLAQRDPPSFYRNLWIYLATFALAVPYHASVAPSRHHSAGVHGFLSASFFLSDAFPDGALWALAAGGA